MKVVRLGKANVYGYLIAQDPRNQTAFVYKDKTMTIVHGHAIEAIQDDPYAEPSINDFVFPTSSSSC